MIHNEAHYVASHITFLKNAEIVFSVDNSPPNLCNLHQCFKRHYRLTLLQTNRV